MKENIYVFVIAVTVCGHVLAAPAENSLVVSTTETSNGSDKEGKDAASTSPLHLTIYEMDISTNISNRFAKTLVTSKVKNSDTHAKETTFTVVLPEKAFISEFVMEIGGKTYKAYVKEKEEAKNIYDQAVASGQTAGHVSVSARDSNRFTVSINVEPEAKVVFLLTYEELLERRNNQYELVLNIHPGQIVKQLNVDVHINESRPLKFVKTPSLRSGNEISKNEDKLDPLSDIKIINSTSAVVEFHPDVERQKQFAKNLGKEESDGLSGQFIVQYDVERDPHGGEVLLQDGYFVHFFAPTDLEPLPKHVVFVLDTSGSMSGRKIEQLRDAMNSILDEVRKGDLINIIEFNSAVSLRDIESKNTTQLFVNNINFQEPFGELSEYTLPAPTLLDDQTLSKAKSVVQDIRANGGTHMIGGLETALYVVKLQQEKKKNENDKKYQPIIIFLTDGAPNVGIYSTEEIVKIVTRLNSENNNIPIFSLSFGYGANKDFLRKLSLRNQGFSRHIYEASDASLQLQEFYKQISSPLLSSVNFTYESDVKDVTKYRFPIYFGGSELVVTGRYEDPTFPVSVNCFGPRGPTILKPKIETPVTSLERLWAYLTVKQTLDQRDSVENKTDLTKKALDLALKYSFVTDVTSLVVVKPNDTSAVNTEEAGGDALSGPRPAFAFSAGSQSGPPDVGSAIGFSAPRRDSLLISGSSAGFPGLPGLSVATPSPTPFVTPSEPPSTVPIQTIEDSLPWLSSVLNTNGTLTVSGTAYELGEHYYGPISSPDCPKIPINNTQIGTCILLRDCGEVYSALTDFQVYKQYFCPLDNKYAGVCCPKK